jgi:hypothetical protein
MGSDMGSEYWTIRYTMFDDTQTSAAFQFATFRWAPLNNAE